MVSIHRCSTAWLLHYSHMWQWTDGQERVAYIPPDQSEPEEEIEHDSSLSLSLHACTYTYTHKCSSVIVMSLLLSEGAGHSWWSDCTKHHRTRLKPQFSVWEGKSCLGNTTNYPSSIVRLEEVSSTHTPMHMHTHAHSALILFPSHPLSSASLHTEVMKLLSPSAMRHLLTVQLYNGLNQNRQRARNIPTCSLSARSVWIKSHVCMAACLSVCLYLPACLFANLRVCVCVCVIYWKCDLLSVREGAL